MSLRTHSSKIVLKNFAVGRRGHRALVASDRRGIAGLFDQREKLQILAADLF